MNVRKNNEFLQSYFAHLLSRWRVIHEGIIKTTRTEQIYKGVWFATDGPLLFVSNQKPENIEYYYNHPDDWNGAFFQLYADYMLSTGKSVEDICRYDMVEYNKKKIISYNEDTFRIKQDGKTVEKPYPYYCYPVFQLLMPEKEEKGALAPLSSPETPKHIEKKKPVPKTAAPVPEPTLIVTIQNTLVRGGAELCARKGHVIERKKAVVKLIDQFGFVKEKRLQVQICRKCKKVFIADTDYVRLKAEGVILCRVVDPRKSMTASGRYAKREQESVLHQLGYTVNAQSKLTNKQRRILLWTIIESKVLSYNDVVQHLEFLIKDSRNKKNWEAARNKWMSDLKYLADVRKELKM